MPLQKQSIPVSFAMGLDQKTDPKQVTVGRFLGLINRVFNKMGLFQKRFGFAPYGQTVVNPVGSYTFSQIPGSVAAGRNLSSYADELVLNDGLNIYSLAESANNWVYKGRVELCQTSKQSVYKNQYNNLMPDSALNSTLGLNVFAWESWTGDPYKIAPANSATLSGVQLSAVDANSGLTVFNSFLASTTSRPKCVSISNKLYVIYFNSSGNALFAQPITESGLGVAISLVTNINATTPNYDTVVVGTTLYIAYNGTASSVKVASFDSSMNSVATATKAEVASNGIGVFSDTSNNIWVAYNNGTDTKAFIMNSALAVTVLAPTTVEASVTNVKNVTGIYDGTKGVIFYDKPGVPVPAQVTASQVTSSFTQPAVGATVTASVSSLANFPANNSIVYIPTGGYYYITGAIPSAIAVTLANLGFAGNAAPGATVATLAQSIYPTAGYQNALVRFNTLTAAGVAGTAAVLMRSVFLAGKAFLVNSVPHVITGHDSPLQATYFACALYNVNSQAALPIGVSVAKIADSAGGGLPYRSILPTINTVSTGIIQFSFPERSFEILQTSNNTSNVIFFLGVSSSRIDFTTNDILTNYLGRNLQIGSGILQMYDGASACEQGFNIYPETVTGVASGSDGDLSDGIYGYKIVYQWIDNLGQTHRSAPSPNLSLDVSAANHVDLSIPSLRITEKSSVTIAIYRTEVNLTIYYRLDTIYLTYPINNSVNSDTISFTDYSADEEIVGNEQLYTGQEVENIAPSAVLAITEYKNREILIPSDNRFGYQYSKQVIDGSPVEFSDIFFQSTGTVGGALVGGAKLDDKLALFQESQISYVTGTGPGPSGANNDFSDPQFVTADATLSDPRSLVSTPVGLMFKSEKGIYLLDRSLQTKYIGKDVEDYNQFTVRGAHLMPTGNQVRFILSNGTCLMYNYYWTNEEGIGQWGVFSNVSAVSDCVFGGLHTYVTSAGLVYKESPGLYLDGGTGVQSYFKSSWFNIAGLIGFERAYYFYLLGEVLSATTLTINIYYNYDDSTPAQTITITPDVGELLERRIFFTTGKVKSFLIEVQESGSSGAGFTLSGLNLVVGIKKGYTTIKAAHSSS